MLKETFILESSWIHKIHPIVRIITAILYTTFVALFYEFITLCIALIVSVLMVIAVKLRLKLVAKRLFFISGFLLLIWIVLPLSYELETIGNVSLKSTGVSLLLQITIKTFTISLSFMVLVATMSLDTLGYSLTYINVPKKMIYLLLVAYRYIFLIEREYYKLLWAAKVRNFHPKTNMHTYRTYSYLIGMLFIRAHERAARIHNAMICRNFSGDFFTIRKFIINWQSIMFAFCVGLILIMLLFFEIKF